MPSKMSGVNLQVGSYNHFEMRSVLKGKNLLLEEQILSFKSRPQLRGEAQLIIG